MKKKDRVDDIIEKATKLFNSRGYFGVSISEIASACGMSKASIYYHFATKDQLAAACMSRIANEIIGPVFVTDKVFTDKERRIFVKYSRLLISFSIQLNIEETPLTAHAFNKAYGYIHAACDGLRIDLFLKGIN